MCVCTNWEQRWWNEGKGVALQCSIYTIQSTALKARRVVQEAPSNPSLDELHAEDVKDEEADDRVEDAKKVADCLRQSFCAFVFLLSSCQLALVQRPICTIVIKAWACCTAVVLAWLQLVVV